MQFLFSCAPFWDVFVLELAGVEGGDLILPCTAPKDLSNFNLTWSFLPADHPLVILTYNSSTQWMAEGWAGQAQLDAQRVKAGDGSLKLQNLQSLEHSGVYTCSFAAHQNTHAVHIRVNVTTARSKAIITGPRLNNTLRARLSSPLSSKAESHTTPSSHKP